MEKKEKTQASLLPKINLILIVIVIVGLCFLAVTTVVRLNEIDESIGIQAIQFPREISVTVDFTDPRIQEIGKGFKLVKAAQAKHLNGIKFLGRIINTQSVRYNNVTFRITVSDVSKQFTINQISAGNSTRFSVYVPDITVEDARFANIEYITSTIWYQTK